MPSLFAHGALALEWSRLCHGESEVGKLHVERGVACALAHIGRCRDAPLGAGKLIGEVDRAALGVLGEGTGIICVEVVTGITGCGKVHAGRESEVGVGLCVLSVTPQHLEVVHLGVVGVAFVAADCGEIVDAEVAAKLVPLAVIALCC